MERICKTLGLAAVLMLPLTGFLESPCAMDIGTDSITIEEKKKEEKEFDEFIKALKASNPDSSLFYPQNKKTLTTIKDVYLSSGSLGLANRNLEVLPPEIEKLSSLKNLYLDHNNLKTLPLTIENLKNLEILSITYNKEMKLDDRELYHLLKNLVKLKKVVFGNTPLETHFQRDTWYQNEIQDYLKTNQELPKFLREREIGKYKK